MANIVMVLPFAATDARSTVLSLGPRRGARYHVTVVTGGFEDESFVGEADVDLVLRSAGGFEASCSLGGAFSGRFGAGTIP